MDPHLGHPPLSMYNGWRGNSHVFKGLYLNIVILKTSIRIQSAIYYLIKKIFGCKWTFSIGSRGGGVPVAHGGAALRVGQIGWVSHLSAYGPEQKSWYGPPLRSPPLSMYNGWRGNSHVFKGKSEERKRSKNKTKEL